ncbi:Hypothetical Protein FCC1311_038452, partial [Hondaea fermentalgiana]
SQIAERPSAMSSSAQGNARSGVGAESNCIYDDAGSAASGSSNAPSSAAAEPIRDGLPPATSPLRQSFLSRNRQPQQFGSVVLTKPSRLEPIRTCLTWIWLGPVIVTALAGLAVLFGTLCLTEQLVLFDTCGEILVPLGLLLPCAALLVAIYMSQPSTAGQQHDAFYSDALLEEVLAGENILDVYTVTTRGCPPRDGNVVVFLSGVGGVAETWRSHVEAVVDAGFAAIQIQLPGSGCLGAITFSFERAAQTVMRQPLSAEHKRVREQDKMAMRRMVEHLLALTSAAHVERTDFQALDRELSAALLDNEENLARIKKKPSRAPLPTEKDPEISSDFSDFENLDFGGQASM